QIYRGIRRAILAGVTTPGTRLPSSRVLADDLRVSRTTATLALEQLLAEGYLATRRGAGTFVAEDLPDDLPSVPSGDQAPTARRAARPTRLSLSRRGATLAAAPQGAQRLHGPPRAFRIGTPGIDLFPIKLWQRIVNRRLRSVTAAHLDYGDAAGLRPLR